MSGARQSGVLLRPTLPRELLRLLDGGEVRALADLGWLSRLGFPRGLPARLVLPEIGLLVLGLSLLVGEKIEVFLKARLGAL